MIPLLVDLDREWRGGQNQALLTAIGLRNCGHDAQLVAVGGAPLALRASQAGIPVHEISRQARRTRATLLLRKLLSKKQFDVLHANEPHALTAAWMARVHREVSLVVSRRVAYPIPRNYIAQSRYLATHRILAVSRYVAASVVKCGMPADKVEVLYEGVEVPQAAERAARDRARRRWGVTDNAALLGCVGYLLPEKGQECIVRALPAVREKFPGARLLLAGDGPCRARLEQLAKGLKLMDAVVFAGFVEDIAEVYAALDIFVFPSLAEPLGTSLLAAMAWGLPVMAVASGGVPEYVEHGKNGLLIAESSGELAAEGLLQLLSSESLRVEFGQKARQTIQGKFSASAMVQNTLRAYGQTMRPRAR